MRVELTTEECRWLADLAGKAKIEAAQAHEEMPHRLFALRRDNMADLENKHMWLSKNESKEKIVKVEMFDKNGRCKDYDHTRPTL